jgi:pimeloyl-ACP methyl ester carboxylesterase
VENAADIADLRKALGIKEWNVYGVSYGTNVAQVLLRDHPEGIRSMVLDSVSPLNQNLFKEGWPASAGMYQAIFDACASQPVCAAAYPT